MKNLLNRTDDYYNLVQRLSDEDINVLRELITQIQEANACLELESVH